jgi:L-methionine (R)-S-oxide reductase
VLYPEVISEVRAYMDRTWFTNLANTAAVLMDRLPEINWAGFYLLKDQELWLGPFQGKAACLKIPIGNGVCGVVAERRQSIVVPNVDLFPTHIVCDSRSRSEIAVPIVFEDRLLGVLDVDSPRLERFDEVDRVGLEAVVQVLLQGTDWPARF